MNTATEAQIPQSQPLPNTTLIQPQPFHATRSTAVTEALATLVNHSNQSSLSNLKLPLNPQNNPHSVLPNGIVHSNKSHHLAVPTVINNTHKFVITSNPASLTAQSFRQNLQSTKLLPSVSLSTTSLLPSTTHSNSGNGLTNTPTLLKSRQPASSNSLGRPSHGPSATFLPQNVNDANRPLYLTPFHPFMTSTSSKLPHTLLLPILSTSQAHNPKRSLPEDGILPTTHSSLSTSSFFQIIPTAPGSRTADSGNKRVQIDPLPLRPGLSQSPVPPLPHNSHNTLLFSSINTANYPQTLPNTFNTSNTLGIDRIFPIPSVQSTAPLVPVPLASKNPDNLLPSTAVHSHKPIPPQTIQSRRPSATISQIQTIQNAPNLNTPTLNQTTSNISTTSTDSQSRISSTNIVPIRPLSPNEHSVSSSPTIASDSLSAPHVVEMLGSAIELIPFPSIPTKLSELRACFNATASQPPHLNFESELSKELPYFTIFYSVCPIDPSAPGKPKYKHHIPSLHNADGTPKSMNTLFDEISKPFIDCLADYTTQAEKPYALNNLYDLHFLGQDQYLLALYNLLLNGKLAMVKMSLDFLAHMALMYNNLWCIDDSRIENIPQTRRTLKSISNQQNNSEINHDDVIAPISLLPNLNQPDMHHILPLLDSKQLTLFPHYLDINQDHINLKASTNFVEKMRGVYKRSALYHADCKTRTNSSHIREYECCYITKQKFDLTMTNKYLFFILKGLKTTPFEHNTPYHFSPSDLSKYSVGGCLACGQAIRNDLYASRDIGKSSFKRNHPLGRAGLEQLIYSFVLTGKIMVSAQDASALYQIFREIDTYATKEKNATYSQKRIYSYLHEDFAALFPRFGSP